MFPLLLALVVSTPPGFQTTVSDVPCKRVAACWLDDAGKPIKRPAKFRGRALPRGDCGRNLIWLRNQLSCTESLCTATLIGDKC